MGYRYGNSGYRNPKMSTNSVNRNIVNLILDHLFTDGDVCSCQFS